MTDQKILNRIRKVLALAEGTDNPAEAEVMMLKVQAMLDEHNLQLLGVERASEEDPIATDRAMFHHWVKDSWFKWTVVRLGQLYDVKVIWTKVSKNKTLLHVSGRESGRITLQLMVPFVRKQIQQRAKNLATNEGISKAKAERYIANALNDRIKHMVWTKQDREEVRMKSGLRALVPVDLIEAEIERAFGTVKLATNNSTKTTPEAEAEATLISLNRQIQGETVLKIESEINA